MITEELKNMVFTLLSDNNGLESTAFYSVLDYLNTVDSEFSGLVESLAEATDDFYYFPEDISRNQLNIEREVC